HHAPANAGSVAHSSVRIRHAEDALLHEVENFLVERRLEAIGYVAGQRFVQTHWLLTDARVERHRTLNRGLGGLGSAHNLHQRHNMRWIERMTDHTTLGSFAAGLDH